MLGTAFAISVSLGASVAPSQVPLLAQQREEAPYFAGFIRNPASPSETSVLMVGQNTQEGLSTRLGMDQGVIAQKTPVYFGDVKYDAVLSDLLDYVTLEEGWDGYEASPPSFAAIAEAFSFLSLLFKVGAKAPIATISSAGEVGVYWRADDIYCEVGFVGDGIMSYFAEDEQGPILDDVAYSEGTVPTPLFDFLKRNFIRLNSGEFQQAA